MNALVELIKKIGIFMIAAQAVVHFAPEQKYEKYMKLIVGIMILLQFISPVYGILEGVEADWSAQLSNMEQEMQEDGFTMEFQESGSVADAVINNMEEEIKTKLNNELSGENYMVINVTIKLVNKEQEKVEGITFNNSQYVMSSVRVAVRAYPEKTAEIPDANAIEDDMGRIDKTEKIESIEKIDSIEKIQIQQVSLGENRETEQDESPVDREQGIADELRKRFSSVLGMEEKYLEVSVYGTAKEADG